MRSASQAAGVWISLCVSVCCIESGGQRGSITVVTDKSQLYWCVCVVSSHGSLGAQDKQCEVGYKVCPSRTLLSIGRFPLAGPVVPATG